MKNLLAYLAFDRKSIAELLSEKNIECYNEHTIKIGSNQSQSYPLFFKNQDHKSAIDIALERN